MRAMKQCEVCGSLWQPINRHQASRNKTCSPECMAALVGRRSAALHLPASQRLFERIRVDENTGCWNWTAGTNRGYGVLKSCGKPILAHRLSYEIHRGTIPVGLFVCHHCDNPPCVNPEHLFLGTQAANVADMDAKGRRVYRGGEKNHYAKLSEADVLAIREIEGTAHWKIAEQYGVSRSAIQLIKAGKNWKHLKVAQVAALLRREGKAA